MYDWLCDEHVCVQPPPCNPCFLILIGEGFTQRTALFAALCAGAGTTLGRGSQANRHGRRRIAMSQRRARKAQKLGPLAGGSSAAAEAPTPDPAHAGAEAAGTPALAAQGSAAEPGRAGLVQGCQPQGTRAAGPGPPGVAPDGPPAGKQSRKRRGSRRAGSEETRRSLFHGVTWSRKVGKWRAQVRQA